MSAFWIGLVLATALAPFIFKLLIAMKSRQTVSAFAPEGHQVKQGTPTMGGLLIVIPFLILLPFLTPQRQSMAQTLVQHPISIWPSLEFLVFSFTAIGFIDDFVVPRLFKGKRGLGWKQKIIMQLVSVIIYGLIAHHNLLLIGVDVLVILAASNAYNFSDGLDGLAASIALILIPGLVVLSGWIVAAPLYLLAGSIIPFAFLNAPKAKVFMGDVGSLPIGAFFGACLLAPLVNPWGLGKATLQLGSDRWFSDAATPYLLASVVLSLVLLAELIPVPLQIFWVKVFKRKLFPFTPIHHAFEKAGWPETRVVATFALAQLLCTVGAISLIGRNW